MIDMKLNKGKGKNSVTPPVQSTSPYSSFENSDSLKRASVFVSGWQKSENSDSVISRKIITNGKPRPDFPKRFTTSSPLIRKPRQSRRGIFLFLSICVLIGIYALTLAFEKTTLEVKEKKQIITLTNETLNASKEVSSPIHFEVMSVSEKILKDVVLTQKQNVSTKAKGSIVVFNEYSTKPQKLLVNSFVSDTEGKMYRTDSTVLIPGYTSEGDVFVPGQIGVTVTAFLPGESYNGNPTDFTIAGFKGLDKYKKIYGKAQSAFEGGEQGIIYTIDPELISAVEVSSTDELKNNIIRKMVAQVPKGYVFYKNAFSFTSSANNSLFSPTSSTKVEIEGNLTGVILKEEDIIHAVAKNQFPDILPEELNEIIIPNINSLEFNFKDPAQQITKEIQSFSFILNGTVTAEWHPNYALLKTSILGKSKEVLPDIFKNDPGIQSVDVRFFPPWQTHVSKTTSNIAILRK